MVEPIRPRAPQVQLNYWRWRSPVGNRFRQPLVYPHTAETYDADITTHGHCMQSLSLSLSPSRSLSPSLPPSLLYTRIHAHMHTGTHAHMHTGTHTCIPARTRARAHTHCRGPGTGDRRGCTCSQLSRAGGGLTGTPLCPFRFLRLLCGLLPTTRSARKWRQAAVKTSARSPSLSLSICVYIYIYIYLYLSLYIYIYIYIYCLESLNVKEFLERIR